MLVNKRESRNSSGRGLIVLEFLSHGTEWNENKSGAS